MRPGPVGTRRVIDGVLMRLQSCRALVYLYRAIDQYGQAIEVLVSQWRDLVAACQFSAHAPQHGPRPAEVNTDRAAAYPRVLDELLPSAVSRCGAIREQSRGN